MTSKVEVDDGAQVTISLDGTTADVRAGGHGQHGDLVIDDAQGDERIHVGRVVESISSPTDVSPPVTADYVGIRIRDAAGANIAELGQLGAPPQFAGSPPNPVALRLGGGGSRGEIILENESGAVSVRIDAEEGATIKAGNGAVTVEVGASKGVSIKATSPVALDVATTPPTEEGHAVHGHFGGGLWGSGVHGTTSAVPGSGVSGRNDPSGAEGALGTSHLYLDESGGVERHDPVGVAGSARGEVSYGVRGEADHVGVFGRAESELGSRKARGLTEPTGIGVWAQGSWTGLCAVADGSWAGQFLGDVMVNGDLFASGTKTFRIDHPLDPERKYLMHACVESAERLNLYSGTVQLDSDGEARVQLPDWLPAVNGDIRYQLTSIGAPAPSLHVSDEIDDSAQFAIAGGPPTGTVSWQVSGVRQDAHARANAFEVEVAKREAEVGKFVHPAAHGVTEGRGLSYGVQPLARGMRVSRRPASATRLDE